MKRFLLIATLTATAVYVQAQNCNPDNTITQAGVYPEQPDTAFADEAYDFSFQVLALKDTAVIFGGQNLNATIDSIKVNNVIGLPSGFEYTCNPMNCVFNWRAVGCVNVKGNPTQSQVGVYDLKIATTVYAKAGILALPVPDTTDGYELVINGDGSASIFDIASTQISIYPNPSNNGVYMLSSTDQLLLLSIVDIQGKKIDFKSVTEKNSTTINLEEAPKGVYFLSVKLGNKIISKKLVR
ncbi:MAG: T9SS type A sorting domain-containing protein [Bacteroidia bacterium]|jgi:hypothetical protein|nr:T9SS type A sorting domain-containing protein [Bacteroidia bacterium]